MALSTIVVVGASLAGLRAVEAIRRRGFSGRLVWIGAEPHPPYDRPPLSKQLLDGSFGVDRLFFRKKEGLEPLEAELHFGKRAVSLSPSERRVALEDGTIVAYDGLVLATGASARTLPGSPELRGVFTLRTLDDALSIREALARSPRVAVIGAGFIGLEVAAVCRKLRCDVTVIEPLSVPLLRPIGRAPGQALADLHADHGTRFHFGRSAARLEGEGHVESVLLDDGSRVPADLVVVGIGAAPRTDWLVTSGLALSDGVVCDATCFAGAAGVVAAGDVARWPNALFGTSMRLEHWTNAVEQANAAVDRLLDGEAAAKPFAPVPYFWSDQHGVKVQFVGHHEPTDVIHVVENVASERRFTALYEHKGRLNGALVFNAPARIMKYRRLIAEGVSLEDARKAEARS